MKPPDYVIAAAIATARLSPCAKSKRGVAIFDPAADALFVSDHNGRPGNMAGGSCGGACRDVCGKVAVHAESRAIRHAIAYTGEVHLTGLEAVHVKVVDGELVAGGGPSCWQCSREVLDVDLAAIWLFERVSAGYWEDRTVWVDPVDEWRRYTAEEFHAATLRACGLEAGGVR